MKKFICIALALAFALSMSASALEFGSYSDAALLDLLRQVQQEVVDRRIEKTANLKGGEYVAGEDIPTGKFVLKCTYSGDWWANLTIYSASGSQELWEVITEEDGTFEKVITLEKGAKIECDEPFTLTVYAGIRFN